MSERTIFDEIVDGTMPSWKVFEDADYLAFLTPFANTPGVTVVIPKRNPGGYAFDLPDETLSGLVIAAKKVAKLLEHALGVQKVGLVFEGEGVAHVHAKLYPMHGALSPERLSALAHHQEFYPEYPGYLSTAEGPRMSDEQLNDIQQKITGAGKTT